MRRWLRKHGRPVALYTDRDSIYRVEGKLDPSKPIHTQRYLPFEGVEKSNAENSRVNPCGAAPPKPPEFIA